MTALLPGFSHWKFGLNEMQHKYVGSASSGEKFGAELLDDSCVWSLFIMGVCWAKKNICWFEKGRFCVTTCKRH